MLKGLVVSAERRSLLEVLEAHAYSSTQVQLPQYLASAIKGIQDLVPEEDLAEDGKESDYHITVKYGLHTNEWMEVAEALSDESDPIEFTFGELALFTTVEKYDVLIVRVQSECLHRLNKKLSERLDVTDTHPVYFPHATVAYIKKGRGVLLNGRQDLNGQSGTVYGIRFFSKGGTNTDILTASPKALTARPESELVMQAAADEHLKKLVKLYEYAFKMGRLGVDRGALETAILARSEESVLAAMANAPGAVGAAMEEFLEGVILKALKAGGDAGIRLLKKRMRAASSLRSAAGEDDFLTMAFDVSNKNAVAWAKKYAAQEVTNITESTRKKIKDVVVKALKGEEGPRELYKSILESIGNKDRAQAISRFELMQASNEGQRQGWSQAVDKGLLNGDEKRVWIATEGACSLCEGLDGQTAPLGEEYPNDGGDGPPLHVGCRCTEGLTA
jgi:2'-5' RNA ligase